MPMELPIRTQGFPQVLRDLGVITPQVGQIWTLSTLVEPIFLVGADAEVSTVPPRYPTANYVYTSFVNPILNSEWGATSELLRGRYSFKFNWFWENQHATAEQTIAIVLQPFLGGTVLKFWTIDVMMSALSAGRQGDRGDLEFCIDVPRDGLQINYRAVAAGAPNPSYVGGGVWWHKYGELPLGNPV